MAEVYERGAYARLLDYDAPLSEPLSTADAAWAGALLSAGNYNS
jgi:hypothetical protein